MGESATGLDTENTELVKCLSEMDRAAAEIRHLSLSGLTFERLLDRGIRAILEGHEWPQGTVAAGLLTKLEDPSTLRLVVSIGLPDEIREKCATVPFGTCLCGRAAVHQEMVVADDEAPHDIQAHTHERHSHLVAPLYSGGKTLGVVNLVIPGHFAPSFYDTSFLHSMCDVLSSVLRRERVTHDLEENHSKLSAIVDAYDGLLYMSSMDYRVEFMNQQFTDLVGHETVGQVCYKSIHNREDPCPWCTNDRVAAGETVRGEVRMPLNDRYYMVVNRPIHHPDGTVSKVSMATDITDRKIAEQELEQSLKQLGAVLEGVVGTLAATTSSRDPYTAAHQERVTRLACAIAEAMGESSEFVGGLRTAALLHDIGKISVPSEILSRPGPLNEMEMGIVMTHPTVGHHLLAQVPFRHPVAEVVLQHHERLDGSGYPRGIEGDAMLPEAKVLAVADVVEAMCSHRPYRTALAVDSAIDEIEKNAGRLYDGEVVSACVRVLKDRPGILSQTTA